MMVLFKLNTSVLVYAVDVNILGGSLLAIKKSILTLLIVGKEVGRRSDC